MSNNNEYVNDDENVQMAQTTNSRWSKEEELSLIKDISNGFSLETLSQKHNRSVSAIEMRLKKIIFENANSGNSLNSISKLLKLDMGKTLQYYYSYKEFYEKKTKTSLTKPTQLIKQINNYNGVGGNMHPANLANPTNKVNQTDQIEKLPDLEKAFGEPSKNNKLESKLKKLEIENKILRLIVENKELTQQLNKLIKDGKVDPSIKSVIKTLRSAE